MLAFIKNKIRHSFLGVLGGGWGLPAAVLVTLLLMGGSFCALFFGGTLGFIPIVIFYLFTAIFSTQFYLFFVDLPNFFYQFVSFGLVSYLRVAIWALESRFSFFALIFDSELHFLIKAVLSPFAALFTLFFLVVSLMILYVTIICLVLPFACFFAPLFILPFVISPVALSAWGVCLGLAIAYALMMVLPLLFVADRLSIADEGVLRVMSNCRRYNYSNGPTVFADLKTALDSWRIQDRRKILFYQGTKLVEGISEDAQSQAIRPLYFCLAKVCDQDQDVSLRYLRSSILLMAHYSGYGESPQKLDEPFFNGYSLAQLMAEHALVPASEAAEADQSEMAKKSRQVQRDNDFLPERYLALMQLINEASAKDDHFRDYLSDDIMQTLCARVLDRTAEGFVPVADDQPDPAQPSFRVVHAVVAQWLVGEPAQRVAQQAEDAGHVKSRALQQALNETVRPMIPRAVPRSLVDRLLCRSVRFSNHAFESYNEIKSKTSFSRVVIEDVLGYLFGFSPAEYRATLKRELLLPLSSAKVKRLGNHPVCRFIEHRMAAAVAPEEDEEDEAAYGV